MRILEIHGVKICHWLLLDPCHLQVWMQFPFEQTTEDQRAMPSTPVSGPSRGHFQWETRCSLMRFRPHPLDCFFNFLCHCSSKEFRMAHVAPSSLLSFTTTLGGRDIYYPESWDLNLNLQCQLQPTIQSVD